MRTLFKDNVVEALTGLLVVLVAVWFVRFAYTRTERGAAAEGYTVTARFPNVGGISVGSDVRVSGMKVGTVTAQKLDPASYQAVTTLALNRDIQLPSDTAAAITSESLLGGSYIALQPGGDPKKLKDGDEITDTQGATDLMGLVGSFINRSGGSGGNGATAPAAPAGAAAPAK